MLFVLLMQTKSLRQELNTKEKELGTLETKVGLR